MNSLCRRFVATFLALILILPSPGWALRELQEDAAVPALERRLRSSSGLEETKPIKILYKKLDATFEEVLALSRRHKVRSYKLYRDNNAQDPIIFRFGYPNNPPPPWDATDLLEHDLLDTLGGWARDTRYYIQITKEPELVGKIWAEIVPVESAAGLEEGTDWTPHWDAGWALADEKDPLALQKEPWRDFFESLRAQSPNARALDIGSGNLAVSLFAQGISPGFDLHAIDRADIKPGRIAQSDRIQFRRGEAERTGYPDGHFDAVTSRFGLEYTDLARSLSEFSRILRPGGKGLLLLHHARIPVSFETPGCSRWTTAYSLPL